MEALSNADLEKKLIALESQLAFQEDIIEQLNQVVTRQETELVEFKAQLERIVKVLSAIDDSGIKDISQESPPPHY